MKQFFTTLALMVFSVSLMAQSNIEVYTGADYANEDYYSFTLEELNNSPRNNWDIAFATDNFDVSVQANNGAGVMVYTYPNGDITAWDNIDTTGMYLWTPLYNSIEDIELGAFNANQIDGDDFDYGWGRYNMTTHKITGDSLFVVKTIAGDYKKFWIVDANPIGGVNTWDFKYADIDGSNEQSITINADDYNEMNFVHYSIDNNDYVAKEPASSEWELLFTRYYDYTIPYYVTGVLANTKRVTLQQVDDVDQASFETYVEADFMPNYAEVGSDWKDFNMSTFTYDINPSRVYFAKVLNADASDSTYWKFYFTNFSGSSDGMYSFTQKDLTDHNSVNEIQGLELFDIYPNPANTYIRLISDATRNLQYQITDISGKLILQGQLEKGFNQESINISDLHSGVYHISLVSSEGISSQTFIKQ